MTAVRDERERRARPAASDAEILGELVARARHDETLSMFRSVAGGAQYHRLWGLVRRFVPAGARVLDWGAGNGHFSYFLYRAGFRGTGYSLGEFTYAEWIGDPTYTFVLGKAPVALPFDDASFDAVASVGVLEHVREPGGTEAESLREIARILRPGGVFICFHFPNRWSWIDLGARVLPGKYHHEFRFTRRDIERLVAEAGLSLLVTGRYGLLPRNSCGALPALLRGSVAFGRFWDALDEGLGVLLSPICQNYLFVARRD